MDRAAFETGIGLRYAAMRDLLGGAGTLAVLHIGAEQTGIAVGNKGKGAGPQARLPLAIGLHRTAPALHGGLPSSNTFAAALLILREFMHHLQFSSITVVEGRH